MYQPVNGHEPRKIVALIIQECHKHYRRREVSNEHPGMDSVMKFSETGGDAYRFQVNLGGIIDLLSNHLYSSPQVYAANSFRTPPTR